MIRFGHRYRRNRRRQVGHDNRPAHYTGHIFNSAFERVIVAQMDMPVVWSNERKRLHKDTPVNRLRCYPKRDGAQTKTGN